MFAANLPEIRQPLSQFVSCCKSLLSVAFVLRGAAAVVMNGQELPYRA